MRAAQDRGGAAEKRGIPEVEPALHLRIKHLVFTRTAQIGVEIFFDGIGVDEEVGRLHQEELRVFEEAADRVFEDVDRGHVIGVEQQQQITSAVFETKVDVAGRRMFVASASEVLDAELRTERLQMRAPRTCRFRACWIGLSTFLVGAAVVQQINAQLGVWITYLRRCEQGYLQQVGIFVVGGNEDIYCGPAGRIRRQRHALAQERLRIDEHAEQINRYAVHLGRIQGQRCAIAREIVIGERAKGAPEEIARGEIGTE